MIPKRFYQYSEMGKYCKAMGILALVAILAHPFNYASNQMEPLHGETGYSWAGAIDGWVTMLRIDPINTKTIYSIIMYKGLFRSTDMGASWTRAHTGIADEYLTAFTIDSNDSKTVYAGSSSGIYKSTNEGATWQQISSDKREVFEIFIQKAERQKIYAITGRGLFRSDNDGMDWAECKIATKDRLMRILSTDPADERVLYGSLLDPPSDVSRLDLIKQDWASGLYISTNYGLNWKLVSLIKASALIFVRNKPSTIYAATNEGVMMSADSGKTWADKSIGLVNRQISSLIIDQNDPRVLFATTRFSSDGHIISDNWAISRVYKSKDGGESWNRISDFPAVMVAIDRNNSSIVYAATPGGGVFKSTDAGGTWKTSNIGLLSR
jgi:photosystem II stability/assembly factor-like uncharacterized protein